jgi:hypothetical protein
LARLCYFISGVLVETIEAARAEPVCPLVLGADGPACECTPLATATPKGVAEGLDQTRANPRSTQLVIRRHLHGPLQGYRTAALSLVLQLAHHAWHLSPFDWFSSQARSVPRFENIRKAHKILRRGSALNLAVPTAVTSSIKCGEDVPPIQVLRMNSSLQRGASATSALKGWRGRQSQVSTAGAQKPITRALQLHDPEIAACYAVRAADVLAVARFYPLNQLATFSGSFWRRVVQPIASLKYLIASDTRMRFS